MIYIYIHYVYGDYVYGDYVYGDYVYGDYVYGDYVYADARTLNGIDRSVQEANQKENAFKRTLNKPSTTSTNTQSGNPLAASENLRPAFQDRAQWRKVSGASARLSGETRYAFSIGLH